MQAATVRLATQGETAAPCPPRFAIRVRGDPLGPHLRPARRASDIVPFKKSTRAATPQIGEGVSIFGRRISAATPPSSAIAASASGLRSAGMVEPSHKDDADIEPPASYAWVTRRRKLASRSKLTRPPVPRYCSTSLSRGFKPDFVIRSDADPREAACDRPSRVVQSQCWRFSAGLGTSR